jgi:hypothetical protein
MLWNTCGTPDRGGNPVRDDGAAKAATTNSGNDKHFYKRRTFSPEKKSTCSKIFPNIPQNTQKMFTL